MTLASLAACAASSATTFLGILRCDSGISESTPRTPSWELPAGTTPEAMAPPTSVHSLPRPFRIPLPSVRPRMSASTSTTSNWHAVLKSTPRRMRRPVGIRPAAPASVSSTRQCRQRWTTMVRRARVIWSQPIVSFTAWAHGSPCRDGDTWESDAAGAPLPPAEQPSSWAATRTSTRG